MEQDRKKFNEWCAEFNVSSKYKKEDVIKTRTFIPAIIRCEPPSTERTEKENKMSYFYRVSTIKL